MASTTPAILSPASLNTTHTRSSPEELPLHALSVEEITSHHPLPDDNTLEPDLRPSSSYSSFYPSTSDNASLLALKSSSIYSSLSRGILHHGRRYQAFREGEYWSPSDEQQFESQSYGHVVMLVLDCEEPNRLFRSPIADIENKTGHVLDIRTGDAVWAVDVADAFPDLTVHAVDLHPPPSSWVPPNCILEVEDLTQDWLWNYTFDLIHLRRILGSFTEDGWRKLYAQAYAHLTPGGWIEQVEPSVHNTSDDSSLPSTSLLASWGDNFIKAGEMTGRPMNTIDTMRKSIEDAGFVNVGEKLYKSPFGEWPRHPVYKDAGRLNEAQFRTGMEGYALHLLTSVLGWSEGEVKEYIGRVEEELKEPGWRKYHYVRRVWAQKPYDEKIPTREGRYVDTRSLDEITLTSERAYSFVSESTAHESQHES